METPILQHPASKKIFEEELIEEIRNGEQLAFARLYKMYAAALLGVITRIVLQKETAEDLLQECFLKINKNISSYDQRRGKLFTWMLNIARHIAIDHNRLVSSRNEKKTFEFEDVSGEIRNRPAEGFNVDTIGLKVLINQLSEKHQEIIILSYFKGYSHVEIADLLHMPLGSVKTAIRMAIIALRKNFPHEAGYAIAVKSA